MTDYSAAFDAAYAAALRETRTLIATVAPADATDDDDDLLSDTAGCGCGDLEASSSPEDEESTPG